MHNIIYQILTRNQQLACRLYVQRIINRKNRLLPNPRERVGMAIDECPKTTLRRSKVCTSLSPASASSRRSGR